MTTVSGTGLDDLMRTMNGARQSTKTTAEDAENRFMTLLVTQMRNQDPLNPLDNAQVTSQLAQLSTVTGIDKLNTSLQGLQASYQVTQSMQAANLIGHGVLVPGSTVDLGESGGLLGFEMTSPADKVTIKIYDGNGNPVDAIELSGVEAGSSPVIWDGVLPDGSNAEPGRYSFEVEAERGGTTVPVTRLAFGRVDSVSMGGSNGVRLNIAGIGQMTMSDVREII